MATANRIVTSTPSPDSAGTDPRAARGDGTSARRHTESPADQDVARGESLQLLRRAQAGDRDAFGELYTRHIDLITRYIAVRMRHRDPDAVPDLVHDAFCQALDDLASATEDVHGWLLRLAARACTRHDWFLRRYLRGALTVHEQWRFQAPIPATAASTYSIPIDHLLAGLAPDERRAVQLRFLEGQRRQVTAHLMGTTPSAIKRLERRALTTLRAAASSTGLGTGAR